MRITEIEHLHDGKPRPKKSIIILIKSPNLGEICVVVDIKF